MPKHLFLTGPVGCGKSALLRRTLGSDLSSAGGFVTQEEYGNHGELTGLALAPAAAAAGISGFTTERFLDCSHFPPSANNEVFRETGVRLLRETAWYPYACLDEFGGFELIIPQFRSALYDVLDSDLPLVGTVKTEEEADAMRQALGLGNKVLTYLHDLHKYLLTDPDTLLLSVDNPEDVGAYEALMAWKREYLG